MIRFRGFLARRSAMPTPFAPRIILSQNARTDLHAVLRAHCTPQALGVRARLVFRAAAPDTPTHRHMGRDLGCANHTVGTWRRRSLARGFSSVQDALRPGRPRTIASPTRVKVLSVASAFPQDQERPVTRWTLDEIVATLREALHTDAIRRSSLWRLLHDVDLKPHTSADGLQSPEEPFEATAPTRGQLDAQALASYQHGRLGMGCDEQPGRQVLERTAPTPPAQPGRRERRAPEDIRHGTRVLIHSLAVATGPRAWTMGATRKTTDFVVPLQQASQSLPRLQGDDGVMDNVNPHGSLDVCHVVARWCQGPFAPHQLNKGGQRRALLRAPSPRHGFPCTPQHGAWLKQAEWFFGVLPRRFLARGSFPSAQDFARRWERFFQDDNARHAHPSRWTYTGAP
jgi:transposase